MTSRRLKTSPAEYARARKIAVARLWQCRPGDEPLTYGNLAELIDMPHYSGNFWKVLDGLSREVVNRQGPPISVLVVNAGTLLPSGLFYRLARELRFEFEDEEAFAQEQTDAALGWIDSHPDYD